MKRRVFLGLSLSFWALPVQAMPKLRLSITGLKNTLAAKFVFCPDNQKISQYVYSVKVDRQNKSVVVLLEQGIDLDEFPAVTLLKQLEKNKSQKLVVYDKNNKELYSITFHGIGNVLVDIIDEIISNKIHNKLVFEYTLEKIVATDSECPVL